MAASTNINGWNVGGNNNSFDQRGHFYRGVFSGNVTGMLVKQNSTPNMTVLVEHGSALLNKNTTSASVAEIKSDTSVTIDTANTSNPRIDTVVIYEDTSIAIPTVEANYWQDGAGGRFKIVSLPGTAAASPVALSDATIQTTIGAGKPWARLANITVPANSTTIINSNVNNLVRAELGAHLPNNSVTTAAVANSAVTAAKIDFTTLLLGMITPIVVSQGSTGMSDMTGSNLTVNIPSGRKVRFAWSVPLMSLNVSGSRLAVQLNEGSTVHRVWSQVRQFTLGSEIAGETILTGLSGSHTFKLVFGTEVGSGTTSTNADAAHPVEFYAEIVG